MTAAFSYLQHLSRATHKINEREHARQKLILELAALKRINTPTLQKHLSKLEHAIHDTLKAEQQILTQQKQEDTFHSRMQEDLHHVDSLIDKYLSATHHQQERIGILDKTLTQSTQKRTEALANIAQAIKRLETLYAAELSTHKHKKKLQHIKQRIHHLQSHFSSSLPSGRSQKSVKYIQ